MKAKEELPECPVATTVVSSNPWKNLEIIIRHYDYSPSNVRGCSFSYDSLTSLPVICSGINSRHCTLGNAFFSSFCRYSSSSVNFFTRPNGKGMTLIPLLGSNGRLFDLTELIIMKTASSVNMHYFNAMPSLKALPTLAPTPK